MLRQRLCTNGFVNKMLAVVLVWAQFLQVGAVFAATTTPPAAIEISSAASGTSTTSTYNTNTTTSSSSSSTSTPLSNLLASNLTGNANATNAYHVGTNTSSLGLSGPVSLGVNYDTLFGAVFNGEYAQKISDSVALAALADYGPNEYRISGTAGYQLFPQDWAKVTAEYLSQVLPFSFDSGDINQRVGQAAYGLQLQHNFDKAVVKNVNMGGYWAKAPNTALSTVNFVGTDGLTYTNERNLAGATSQGLNVGSDFLLSKNTSLGAKLYYDTVNYNTVLTSNEPYNEQGIGGGLKINQLVGDRIKVSADAEVRPIYDTYGAGVDYVPSFGQTLGLKIGLFAQHLNSKNQTPDSDTYGVAVSMLSDEATKAPKFQVDNFDSAMDLAQWVRTPAVHMERVLVIAEQLTYLAGPNISSIVPNSGPFDGANVVTINGYNFLPGVQVLFNGQPATSVSIISSTQLSVIVPAFTLLSRGTMGSADTVSVSVEVINTNGQTATFPNAYTYVEGAASLTAVTPNEGHAAGGNTVILEGNNFDSTSAISFGSNPVTSFTVNSNAQITAVVPAAEDSTIANTVSITMTTPAGTITFANAYTYYPVPIVSSVVPSAGASAGGDRVDVNGAGFIDATAVLFGSSAVASFNVVDDTHLLVVTPAGTAGTHVTVTVTTPGGTGVSSGTVYLYGAEPTITSLTPAVGSTSGHTSVVIAGTNLLDTTSVTFGGLSATITNRSGGAVTVLTPAHAAGAVDVILTTADGTVTSSGAYTYGSPPTISAVSPSAGSTSGSNSVTLTGTNFTGATAVRFGTKAVTTFTVNSATSLSVVTPAGSTGAVDVTVTTPDGSALDASAYTYGAPPTISAISPTTGSTTGSTSVTITGTNLSGTTSVTFGGVAGTNLVTSATSLTVKTPAGSAGAVNVVVTTPDGAATSTNGFTYVAVPTVTGISPTTGGTAGGTSVTVTGTNLSTATTVTFGGVTGTIQSGSITATSLIVLTPAHALGAVSVVLTTAYGSATSPTSFTYGSAPTLSSNSPTSGTTLGGTSVVLTGTNLSGTTGVTFGGTAGTLTAIGSTSVTVTSPAGSAGSVNIVLTTPDGTATLFGGFVYGASPTVTSMTPATGSTAGGDAVTLTGTNLSNTSKVTFGGTVSTIIGVPTATSVTVSTPAGTGSVSVVLTTPYGTATASTPFVYGASPTITSIAPNAGSTLGGTSVVITGTNLAGTSSVTFDGVAGTITLKKSTSVTVTAPAHASGAVNVVVTTPDGSATSTGGYTYGAAPVVSSISPNNGSAAGGTSVTLTGTTLASTSSVTFGGTAGTITGTPTSTTVTVTTPAGTVGSVNVVLTTPDGSYTLTNGYTYGTPAALTSISPSTGSTSGGTSVTLTGTSLSGTTQVIFGTTAGVIIGTPSATSVTVSTPPGAAGVVSVTAYTADGNPVLTNGFTYGLAPTITAISNNTTNTATGSTAGGTTVTITGTSLSGTSSVTFGGVAGVITAISATSVTVTTPAGSAGAVNVVLTTPDGSVTSTGGYTYGAPPTVTSTSPSTGPTNGGSYWVTVNGTNLSTATSIYYGENQGIIIGLGSTSLTTIPNGGGTGSVNVVVTTLYGAATLTNGFTYAVLPPTVSGVSPNSGLTTGGTSVTLTGTYLVGVTSVTFGGVAGTVTSQSPGGENQLIVTTPNVVTQGLSGAVNIVVTTPDGSTTVTGGFTYYAQPSVTSIAPTQGSTAGGDTMTITGTNLYVSGGTTVAFVTSGGYGVAGTLLTSPTPTSTVLTVSTPPAPQGVSGAVNIEVSTPGGTGIAPMQYVYGAPPAVNTMTPVVGPTTGSTVVTLTGTNLSGTTGVTFGGIAGTSLLTSATSVTVTTPAHSAGTATVVLTTPDGTATLTNGFTYGAAPTVTSIAPSTGSINGGTTLVITGTNLSSTSLVQLGTAVAIIKSVTSTAVTITTPSGTGTVDVTVTTPYGSATSATQFTYGNPPTLTSVSPDAGATSGSNVVTITGTNLSAASAVLFGSNVATITATTSTSVTVSVPADPTTGAVNVSVTTPDGTATLSSAYTYGAAPTISSVNTTPVTSPTAGPLLGGTSVTIAGTNLSGATSVTFGGVAGTGLTSSSTSITVTTPASVSGAGAVNVTVTTPDGIATLTGGFTYDAIPTVTNISPTAGGTTLATTVTITGTNLSTATQVAFGSVNGSIISAGATSLTVSAPPQSAGAVNVVVTTPGGSATSPTQYTYGAAPTISSLSSSTSSTAGGEFVYIYGENLLGTTSVTFGGNPGTNINLASNTSIAVQVPAHAAGAVSLVLTTPDGTASTTFTYGAPPTITAMAPHSGSTAGNDSLIFTGTNLSTAQSVSFTTTGGTTTYGTIVGTPTATSVTASTPSGTGTVTVGISTAYGTATSPATFTYGAAPTITSITPSTGSTLGGTSVVIVGVNLSGTESVTFGGVAGTVVSRSGESLTVRTPAGSTGAVNVVVTTLDGAVTSTGGYTYGVAPVVSTISPNYGTVNGGTLVTLTGTNLSGTTGVTLGGVAATSVIVQNSTSVTLITPAHAAGSVDVITTTPDGTYTVIKGYVYGTPAALTSISPALGTTAGGTTVTLTGTDLSTTTAVQFGTTQVPVVGTPTSTSVVAVTPAGTAGIVNVTAITSDRGSAILTNGYTYGAPPTITQIANSTTNTATGSTAGGTTVTLTGTNLSGTTSVTFGGVSASITTATSTTLTVTTPAGSAGAVDVVVTTPDGSATSTGGFTYGAPPTLTNTSPSTGPTGSDNYWVAVNGTNLSTATSIYYGANIGTIIGLGSTNLNTTPPTGTAGTVNVTVNTQYGTATLTNGYTYANSPPTVSSVNPSFGLISGGTDVELTGTYLIGSPMSVTFGGVAGTNIQQNSGSWNTLHVTTPAVSSAGAVDIVVTTPDGSATVTNGFTYYAVPTITSISPTTGSTAGGTTVVISGTNLYVSGQTSAFFNGVKGTILSSPTPTSTAISVLTPAGSAGAVNVTVQTPGGTATSPTQFTYGAPPTISNISPNVGTDDADGPPVVITGANLSGTTGVTFDGNAATGLTNVSSGSVTVTPPAGAAGTANVVLTTVDGTVTSTNGYTYAAVPILTSIAGTSGASGPSTGGNTVTLTGTGFVVGATTSVSFGSTSATNVVVASSTSITATAPAGSVGSVAVTVTTPGGSSNSTNYTYFGAPTVTNISPAASALNTSQSVTITGTNFIAPVTVTLGTVTLPASDVTVYNATTIWALVPAEASAGTVNVNVTNDVGSSTTTTTYTYEDAPTITSISPTFGGVNATQSLVTITGTGLAGASSVTFGGVTSSIASSSSTQIQVLPPESATPGYVDVVVTTPAGTVTSGDGYGYFNTPVITSLNPTGSSLASSVVTITGTGFTGATAVLLEETISCTGSGAGCTVNSDTSISVTTPTASATATAQVNVVGPAGTSNSSTFTYTAVPTIATVTPSTISTSATTAVTITGTNFVTGSDPMVKYVDTTTGDTAISVNSSDVTISNNGTKLTFTAPVSAVNNTTLDVHVYVPNGAVGVASAALVGAVPPVITSITPDSFTLNGTQPTLTVTGENFVTGNVGFSLYDSDGYFISFYSAIYPTVLDGNTLTMPPPYLAPGTYYFSASTTDGGASNLFQVVYQ